MKNTIFWDITPCSMLKVNWCFREAVTCHPLSHRYFAWLIRPRRCRRYAPPKLRLTFNRLCGIISQQIVLCNFKTVSKAQSCVALPAVRSSTFLDCYSNVVSVHNLHMYMQSPAFFSWICFRNPRRKISSAQQSACKICWLLFCDIFSYVIQ
jgi:hypothetical protein